MLLAGAAASLLLACADVSAEQHGESFPLIGLRTDSDLVVSDTTKDSPARQAGIEGGDRITSIDGKKVELMDHAAAVRSMRGAAGTHIALTLSRAGKTYTVSMTRTTRESGSTPSSSTRHSVEEVPTTPSASVLVKDSTTELDRRLVSIVERTELTDQVYQSVVAGLALLPRKVKQSFLDAGIKVVITPTIDKIPGAKGGRSEYSSKLRSVIICEKNVDGTKADLGRMNLIILHELGHAFDQLLNYPSRGAQFHALYNKEAPLIASQSKQRLSYFLQTGEAGPRECFASLFCCKYYSGDDKRETALRTSFPESFAYVKSLHF